MARIRKGEVERTPSGSGSLAATGRGNGQASASRAARGEASLTVSRPELLDGDSDKNFRALVHGLFSFLASHETIRSGHARFIGLAGVEYTALISIAHLGQEGDVGVSAVAQHLRVSGAFVTNVCRRLIAQGLISKETDPRDRRRVSLKVTAKGRRLLLKLAPVQRQVNDAEFAGLSREEFKLLLDIVERLIACGERAVALQHYLHTNSGHGR
ncbi:MAG: MarR family winged helix-turn-helix transcriptional regulator [Hyphomicrobiaceae bacterium]